jgi:hypothetical protein
MATPDEQRPDLIALIDLDQQDADAVCDAMANVGLEAVPHRLDHDAAEGGIGRVVVRIYVPRAQLRDARDVVRGVLPEYRAPGSPARPASLAPSEEEQWSRIVADLRGEGLDVDVPAQQHPAQQQDAHAEEPGFTPPTPPPLTRPHRVTLLAWAAIAAGVVLVLIGLGAGGEKLLAMLGIAGFIGGFITLVARAGEGNRTDDPDDGAVV